MKFIDWHKSTYSGGDSQNCVAQGVSANAAVVGVRDTKEGEQGRILAVSPAAWSAFVGFAASQQ